MVRKTHHPDMMSQRRGSNNNVSKETRVTEGGVARSLLRSSSENGSNVFVVRIQFLFFSFFLLQKSPRFFSLFIFCSLVYYLLRFYE